MRAYLDKIQEMVSSLNKTAYTCKLNKLLISEL